MEEKKISEKEGLEIISQMIKQTQKKLAKGAGNAFIVWGVIMMVTSVAVGLGIQFTRQGEWMWGYFAIPIIGFMVNFINKKRSGRKEISTAKTYIEEVLEKIWGTIGAILLAYPVVVLVLRIHEPRAWIGMFFLGVFMPVVGAYLTGQLLKIRMVKAVSEAAMGGSLLLLADLMSKDDITNRMNFAFAFFTFISMVVPGIIINREARKEINDKSALNS